MKHQILRYLAAGAAVLLGTAACNKVKEKEFDPNDPSIWTIAVQPESQTVSAEKGSVTYTFTAPDYWRVSSPEKWLRFEPESGKPGQVTLTVTADQNTGQERNALVTVSTKYNRGKFTITQSAWPYSADTWVVIGTVQGGEPVGMEDKGDKLVWGAARLHYYLGESFKFRMGTDESTILGLAGALTPVEGQENTYTAALQKGGESIILPENGYWDVTLDMSRSEWTVTVSLQERFDWTLVGTVNGGDWTQDNAMTSNADKLVWEIAKLPYHAEEEFRFRMDANDAFNLGLDGELTAVEDAEGTYTGSLKADGGNVTLPIEGFWNLTLDVENQTLTAVFAGEFPKPEPNPLPSNWEALWLNDGSHGQVAWDGIYRFGLEGHDGGHECVATFPQEVWDRIKSETIYVYLSGENPQIRVVTGWWEAQLTPNDIQPGNELLTDNEAYTWILKVNLSGHEDMLEKLDQQHLLFTGSGYTVLGIYAEKKGVPTLVKNTVWSNDGSAGEAAWDGVYRFCLEGRDNPASPVCIAEFPADVWARIKSETFYVTLTGANPQIRVVTGWWEAQLTSTDIQPGHELLTDNRDGTWTLTLNLSENGELVSLLDDHHLLFTGSGFALQEIYFEEIQWIPVPAEIDIAPFTLYEDRSATLTYPYYPSWGDNSGKLRIMRGMSPALESLGLTTNSKFIVYKEVGTTGQIQFNNPNWGDLNAGCNDWSGNLDKIEVAVTEDMLKCISGEVKDGWSDTAIILQGDGLKVTKIVILP